MFLRSCRYADQIQSNQNVPSSSETISTSSEKISNTQEQLESAAIQQGVPNEKIDQLDQKIQQAQQTDQVDSVKMLEQQEKNMGVQDDFKPTNLKILKSYLLLLWISL